MRDADGFTEGLFILREFEFSQISERRSETWCQCDRQEEGGNERGNEPAEESEGVSDRGLCCLPAILLILVILISVIQKEVVEDKRFRNSALAKRWQMIDGHANVDTGHITGKGAGSRRSTSGDSTRRMRK